MDKFEVNSDNEEFNYSTFLNVAKKAQSEKPVDAKESFEKEVIDEPEKGIEEQAEKLKCSEKVTEMETEPSTKEVVAEDEVEVKTQTSESLSSPETTRAAEISNREDIDVSTTEEKSESKESSSESSSDESDDEVILPPPKPVKPLSENFKAMSIRQSVLHGESKYVKFNNDLSKENEVSKEIKYMDANKRTKLIGHVMNTIGNECVNIVSLENSKRLDIGTVVVLENKRILGPISDIYGPTTQPMYAVLTENNEGVNVRDQVHCDESAACAEKVADDDATDASWVGDQECPPNNKDYSDDEEERDARKQKIIKSRNKRNDNEEGSYGKRNHQE